MYTYHCCTCGIDLIRKNERKNTIRCPDCATDRILAHPDVVMDAAVVMDQCPTLKQSQLRSAHLFSSPESTKHLPRCSECDKLATHFCKSECGLLCEQHQTIMHKYPSCHQCSSLEEIKKKKAATRVEEAKKTAAELTAQLLKLAEDSDFKAKVDKDSKDRIQKIDKRIMVIDDIISQAARWICDLQHLRELNLHSSSQMAMERQKITSDLQARLDDLNASGLLSVDTSLAVAADEFQRLVHEEVKSDLSSHLKNRLVLPDPHRIISLAEELNKPKLLPSLKHDGKAKLELFLKESGKSIGNASLLFTATWHGWNKDQFLECCAGKSDTLMLVQVARAGWVFGAYLAPAWPAPRTTEVVPDPSLKSFIFSLTNCMGPSIRLLLTEPSSAVKVSSHDLSFGRQVRDVATGEVAKYFNMHLFHRGQPANHSRGIGVNDQNDTKFAYQLDEESKRTSTGRHLDHYIFGGQYFGASEIEVYQL